MAQIEVSEASGTVLDWMVAKCEGFDYTRLDDGKWSADVFQPSTNWAHGGPIIEREGCFPSRYYGAAESRSKVYQASAYNGSYAYAQGPTPLIAAMRCYVTSKLGDTVEVPVELIGA